MKVGIIGAGTMGSGIAQAFAQTEGAEVMLCDINETFAANGKNKIAKTFEKMVAKGKMTQETADAIVARIGLAVVFGVLLKWGYMGYWFGTTLAEIVPILIGVIFYFVSVRRNCKNVT